MPKSLQVEDLPPIVTLLSPSERPHVDAAGEGYYRTVHRESVDDVVKELKSIRVRAVLVSVTYAGAHVARVASVVREFPRVPTVALLSDLQPRTPQAVLTLGHSGIRRLVDVRLSSGWQQLRGALMADSADSGQRTVLGQLSVDLAGVPEDCWEFFEALFTCPPRVGNVAQLSKVLGVLPSTMMSRFYRAQVPAPKRYLAGARLIRAARLFENSGYSIANVSNHLDYSSPQSFGRHIRCMLKMSAREFRIRYDGASMFERFRSELITPYVSALRELHPLSLPSSWSHGERHGRRTIPAPRSTARSRLRS